MSADRPIAEGTIRFTPDMRSLANVEKSVKKAVTRIEAVASKGGLMSKSYTQPLGKITGATDEFTKSLEASNARVIAFGASAGIIYTVQRAISASVGAAINLEKTLADINVILNETNSGLRKFSQELFAIAKGTGQSFNAVSEAALEFARQGLAVEETLKRTRDAMILVRLSGLDVQSSVEAVTATLNSFNQTVITSTQLINKLANVDAAFAVSSADLAEAIRRVGSSAQDANVGIDELIAMVTTAQQVTARGGSVIGNSLKTIFTRLQRPAVLKDLEAFGVKVKDASGAMLPAMQVLKNFSGAYGGLAPAQKAVAAEMVGGVFQVNVLKAAVGDLGKQFSIYDRALGVSVSSTDQAIERNKLLNKTLSTLINESLVNVQKVGAAFANLTITPALTQVLESVNSAVDSLTQKAEEGDLGLKFGKGILAGISNILKGPALIAIAGILGKLTFSFFKFSTDALKTFTGLNDTANRQKEMQQLIQNILIKNPTLIQAATSSAEGLKMVEQQILNIVQAQNVAMNTSAQLSSKIAGNVSASNLKSLNSSLSGTAAAGFVPNYSRKNERAERAGAIQGGYMPGNIETMQVKGVGTVTWNDAETVKTFPGMEQPAIMPPRQSDAGKNYEKKFKAAHGFNPYAQGFVPNFNKGKGKGIRVIDGDTIAAMATEEKSYRLAKVDAAEVSGDSKTRHGSAAKELLISRGWDKKKFDSTIAKGGTAAFKRGLFSDEAFQKLLVTKGLGVPDLRYADQSYLSREVKQAQDAGLGVWGDKTKKGAYTDPLAKRYRSQLRLAGKEKNLDYLTKGGSISTMDRKKAKKAGLETRLSQDAHHNLFSKKKNKALGFIPNLEYGGLRDEDLGDSFINVNPNNKAKSIDHRLTQKEIGKRVGGKTLIRGPEGETLVVGGGLEGKSGSITVGGLSARKIKKANPKFASMLDQVPNLFDGLAYQIMGAVGAKFDPEGAKGAVAGVKFEQEFAAKHGLPEAGAKKGSDFILAEKMAQDLGTQKHLQLKLSVFEKSKRDVEKTVDIASSFSKYLVDMLTNNIKTQGLSKLVGPDRFRAAMGVLKKNPALKSQWSGYFGKAGMMAEGLVPNLAVDSSFGIKQRARLKKMFPSSPLPGESVTGDRGGLTRAQRAGIMRKDRGNDFDEGWDGSYDAQGRKAKTMTGTRFIKGSTGGTEWYHGRIEKPSQAGKLKKIPQMQGAYGVGSYFYDRMASSTKWIQERMMDRGAGLDPVDKAKSQAFFEENKRMVGTMYKFKIHDSKASKGGKFGSRVGTEGEMLGASVAVVPNPAYQIFQSSSVIARPSASEWKEYENAIEAGSRAAAGGKGLGSLHDYASRPDQVSQTSFELWKKDGKQFEDNWTNPNEGGKSWARGLVPNFAQSALGAAIGREMGAGYSRSQVKVGYDSRLAASGGIGVYNSTEGSLSRAISMHAASGKTMGQIQSQGASRGQIPNFEADAGDFLGGGASMMFIAPMFRQMAASAREASEAKENEKKAMDEFKASLKAAKESVGEHAAELEHAQVKVETTENKRSGAAKAVLEAEERIKAGPRKPITNTNLKKLAEEQLFGEGGELGRKKRKATSKGGGKKGRDEDRQLIKDRIEALTKEKEKTTPEYNKQLELDKETIGKKRKNLDLLEQQLEEEQKQVELVRKKNEASKGVEKAEKAIAEAKEKNAKNQKIRRNERINDAASQLAFGAPMVAGMVSAHLGKVNAAGANALGTGIGSTGAGVMAVGSGMESLEAMTKGTSLGKVVGKAGPYAQAAVAVVGIGKAVNDMGIAMARARIQEKADAIGGRLENLSTKFNRVQQSGQKFMESFDKLETAFKDPLKANAADIQRIKKSLTESLTDAPAKFRNQINAAAGDAEKIREAFSEISADLQRQKAALKGAQDLYGLQAKLAPGQDGFWGDGDQEIFEGDAEGKKAFTAMKGIVSSTMDRPGVGEALEAGRNIDVAGADMAEFMGVDFATSFRAQHESDQKKIQEIIRRLFQEIKSSAVDALGVVQDLERRQKAEANYSKQLKALNTELDTMMSSLGKVQQRAADNSRHAVQMLDNLKDFQLDMQMAKFKGAQSLQNPFLTGEQKVRADSAAKQFEIRADSVKQMRKAISEGVKGQLGVSTQQFTQAASKVASAAKGLAKGQSRELLTEFQRNRRAMEGLTPVVEEAMLSIAKNPKKLDALIGIEEKINTELKLAGYTRGQANAIADDVRQGILAIKDSTSNKLGAIIQQQILSLQIEHEQAYWAQEQAKLTARLASFGGANQEGGQTDLSTNFSKMTKALGSAISAQVSGSIIELGRANAQILDTLLNNMNLDSLRKDLPSLAPLLGPAIAGKATDMEQQLNFAAELSEIQGVKVDTSQIDTTKIAVEKLAAQLKLKELPDDVAKIRDNTTLLNSLIGQQANDMASKNKDAFQSAMESAGLHHLAGNTKSNIEAVQVAGTNSVKTGHDIGETNSGGFNNVVQAIQKDLPVSMSRAMLPFTLRMEAIGHRTDQIDKIQKGKKIANDFQSSTAAIMTPEELKKQQGIASPLARVLKPDAEGKVGGKNNMAYFKNIGKLEELRMLTGTVAHATGLTGALMNWYADGTSKLDQTNKMLKKQIEAGVKEMGKKGFFDGLNTYRAAMKKFNGNEAAALDDMKNAYYAAADKIKKHKEGVKNAPAQRAESIAHSIASGLIPTSEIVGGREVIGARVPRDDTELERARMYKKVTGKDAMSTAGSDNIASSLMSMTSDQQNAYNKLLTNAFGSGFRDKRTTSNKGSSSLNTGGTPGKEGSGGGSAAVFAPIDPSINKRILAARDLSADQIKKKLEHMEKQNAIHDSIIAISASGTEATQASRDKASLLAKSKKQGNLIVAENLVEIKKNKDKDAERTALFKKMVKETQNQIDLMRIAEGGGKKLTKLLELFGDVQRKMLDKKAFTAAQKILQLSVTGGDPEQIQNQMTSEYKTGISSLTRVDAGNEKTGAARSKVIAKMALERKNAGLRAFGGSALRNPLEAAKGTFKDLKGGSRGLKLLNSGDALGAAKKMFGKDSQIVTDIREALKDTGLGFVEAAEMIRGAELEDSLSSLVRFAKLAQAGLKSSSDIGSEVDKTVKGFLDKGGDLSGIQAELEGLRFNKATQSADEFARAMKLVDKGLISASVATEINKKSVDELIQNAAQGDGTLDLTGKNEALAANLIKARKKLIEEQGNERKALTEAEDKGLISTDQLREGVNKLNQEMIETGAYGFDNFIDSITSEFTYTQRDFMKDIDQMGREFARDFKSGTASAFGEAIKGTKDLKQAFSDMFGTMADKMLDKSLNMATNAAFGAMGFGEFNKGGLVKGYSQGGSVVGGSGIKDDVPAYLSRGEYVIRRKAVNEYGKQFFESLNGGNVIAAASGGGVGDKLSEGSAQKIFGGKARNAAAIQAERTKRLNALSGAGIASYGYKEATGDTKEDWLGRKTSQKILASKVGFRLDFGKPLNEERIKKIQSAVNSYPEIGPFIDPDIFKKSTVQIGKGATKAKFKNSFIYNETKRPDAGKFNIDSRLSSLALNDEDNPQNKYKFSKADEFFGYQKDRLEYYSDKQKELQEFQDQKAAKRTSFLFGAAAMLIGGAGKGFAKGGINKEDNIPALLTGGEYVMRKGIVDKYGMSFFESLNRGKISAFNSGGYVAPVTGASAIREHKLGEGSKSSEGVYSTNNINISINVDGNGAVTAESDERGASSTNPASQEEAKILADRVKSAVVEVISNEKRPGGMLYGTQGSV